MRYHMLGSGAIIASIITWFTFVQAVEVTKVVANLTKGQELILLAMKHVELALNAKDAKEGAAQIQHVLNILEGKAGPNSSGAGATLGDTYGAVNYLRDAHAMLKESSPRDQQEAVEFALAYLHEADEHGVYAKRGKSFRHNAGLVAGMLSAALGQPGVNSPITGTLAYALHSLQKQ
jgi:hypothetical protein